MEKATDAAKEGKYLFLVDTKAQTRQIAQAIEAQYKVHVTRVNTIRVQHGDKHYKKAVVTLKDGENIDILPRQ
jgi:large subunit ribosomal protein L23